MTTTLNYPTADHPYNCTAHLLSELSAGHTYRAHRYIIDAKPANPKRLTKGQLIALEIYTDHRLGFVSGVLIYDRSLAHTNKRKHRALISLLKSGILQVYQVVGGLRESNPGLCLSYVGANASTHYVIRRVE